MKNAKQVRKMVMNKESIQSLIDYRKTLIKTLGCKPKEPRYEMLQSEIDVLELVINAD